MINAHDNDWISSILNTREIQDDVTDYIAFEKDKTIIVSRNTNHIINYFIYSDDKAYEDSYDK